jgi:hypothetical protein
VRDFARSMCMRFGEATRNCFVSDDHYKHPDEPCHRCRFCKKHIQTSTQALLLVRSLFTYTEDYRLESIVYWLARGSWAGPAWFKMLLGWGGGGKGVGGGRKTDPWEPQRKHLTRPGGKTVENMILAGETSADCR